MKKVRIFLITLLIPACAYSWNGTGHSTGGAVAYYYLKANDPAALSATIEVLKHHPWYNTARWNLSGMTEEQKNVALFMYASTFPDDARNNPDLGGGARGRWHYMNNPFVPAGSTAKGQQPENPNAEVKINEFLKTIPTTSNPEQKAIDLCWLFHLIEDVHQPLHAAGIFDNNHPKGDRGGNETYISFPGQKSPTSLHSYWDGQIKGSTANIPANAQKLLSNPRYAESSLTELSADPTVHDWIFNESFVLAKTVAYGNGAINGTEANPTQVQPTYGQTASATSEKRIVLAGIRLAKAISALNKAHK